MGKYFGSRVRKDNRIAKQFLAPCVVSSLTNIYYNAGRGWSVPLAPKPPKAINVPKNDLALVIRVPSIMHRLKKIDLLLDNDGLVWPKYIQDKHIYIIVHADGGQGTTKVCLRLSGDELEDEPDKAHQVPPMLQQVEERDAVDVEDPDWLHAELSEPEYFTLHIADNLAVNVSPVQSLDIA